MSETPAHLYYSDAAAHAVELAIRAAVRRREISRGWAAIIRCILFECRERFADRVAVSITEIVARLGSCQRQDVCDATENAQECGWLYKDRRRATVFCPALGHNVTLDRSWRYLSGGVQVIG